MIDDRKRVEFACKIKLIHEGYDPLRDEWILVHRADGDSYTPLFKRKFKMLQQESQNKKVELIEELGYTFPLDPELDGIDPEDFAEFRPEAKKELDKRLREVFEGKVISTQELLKKLKKNKEKLVEEGKMPHKSGYGKGKSKPSKSRSRKKGR